MAKTPTPSPTSNAKTGHSNHFQTAPSLHPTQSSLFRPRGLICIMTFCHSGFELRSSILMEYNRVKKATTMYFPLIPSLHLPIAHDPHSFHNTNPHCTNTTRTSVHAYTLATSLYIKQLTFEPQPGASPPLPISSPRTVTTLTNHLPRRPDTSQL